MSERKIKWMMIWLLAVISGFWLAMGHVYGMPGIKSWKAVWDPNQEEDIAGYYLYWRESGGQFSDENRVEIQAPMHEENLGFLPAGNWELAVTAYDSSGNESDFSNIVSFRKDTKEPSAPVNVEITLIISTK